LAELFADDKGLAWPAPVAPATAYLAGLGGSAKVVEAAEAAYHQLTRAQVPVLYDDRRDASAGEMLADADLIGLPLRIIVSEKTVASNTYELKKRSSDAVQQLPADQLVKSLTAA